MPVTEQNPPVIPLAEDTSVRLTHAEDAAVFLRSRCGAAQPLVSDVEIKLKRKRIVNILMQNQIIRLDI